MSKQFLIYFILLLLPFLSKAQETTTRRNRLTEAVVEKISVLKTDKNIKQGRYLALMGDNKALATGTYNNNVKTGVWTFYDAEGRPIQRYDYTNKQLLYEAPEDTTSNCRYVVDRPVKDTDRTTKPIRIGDRYYGYINYLRLFKLPRDMEGANGSIFTPVIELLVSPGGRLADYVVHFNSTIYAPKNVRLNFNLLSEEDRTFFPATINGETVACRIFIRCFLTNDGQLDFD